MDALAGFLNGPRALSFQAGKTIVAVVSRHPPGGMPRFAQVTDLAPERRGGVLAAPALLALATVAFLLPARLAPYAPPGSAEWDSAHQRWTALLGLALVAFVLASRDPAHRRVPALARTLARGRARRRAAAAPRPVVQPAEQDTTKSAPHLEIAAGG